VCLTTELKGLCDALIQLEKLVRLKIMQMSLLPFHLKEERNDWIVTIAFRVNQAL
jgi:hypothetical protein